MSKVMPQTVCAALLVLTVISVMSGCTGKTEVDVGQVRDYADPITESILLAVNEDDYAKYSQHFDEVMKSAVPETVFQQQNSLIKTKIGDYISKEFWKIESKNEFTIVYYEAKFTQEPKNVIVKVVFQEIAGEMCVSGLWFDSANLRK
jgi:hypothetical protein